MPELGSRFTAEPLETTLIPVVYSGAQSLSWGCWPVGSRAASTLALLFLFWVMLVEALLMAS